MAGSSSINLASSMDSSCKVRRTGRGFAAPLPEKLPLWAGRRKHQDSDKDQGGRSESSGESRLLPRSLAQLSLLIINIPVILWRLNQQVNVGNEQ